MSKPNLGASVASSMSEMIKSKEFMKVFASKKTCCDCKKCGKKCECCEDDGKCTKACTGCSEKSDKPSKKKAVDEMIDALVRISEAQEQLSLVKSANATLVALNALVSELRKQASEETSEEDKEKDSNEANDVVVEEEKDSNDSDDTNEVGSVVEAKVKTKLQKKAQSVDEKLQTLLDEDLSEESESIPELPEDYETCAECEYDHEYEHAEAQNAHKSVTDELDELLSEDSEDMDYADDLDLNLSDSPEYWRDPDDEEELLELDSLKRFNDSDFPDVLDEDEESFKKSEVDSAVDLDELFEDEYAEYEDKEDWLNV